MNKISMTRVRYVVVRDDDKIFCGLARNFTFKSINDLGDTAIKTYLSENKAKAALLRSWNADESDFTNGRYRVAKVNESIVEI